MFVLVTCAKRKAQSSWAVNVLRWGFSMLVLTVSTLTAAAPGSSAVASTQTGDPWVAPTPTQGSVSNAPAVAPGISRAPGATPGFQAGTATPPLSPNSSSTPATAPTPVTAPTPPTGAAPTPAIAPTPTPSAAPAQSATPTAAPAAMNRGAQLSPEEAADADPAVLTRFNSQLEPYGVWVDDPRYGRVWVPNRALVGANFSPYVTNGRWALDSEDNWVWVSDYPFGSVVFHYGRWFYSTDHGWAWVPGSVYAPNWVVWRVPTSTYAYVGWAPMPPRYGWFGGSAVWFSSYGSVSYVFCPSDYLFYPGVGAYIVTDPFLVTRLGFYTTFYASPYYYHGYYHHHHHYIGHAGYRPPVYGPPIHRTRITPRAVPRERIAAEPRARLAAASPRASAQGNNGYGRFQRSPVVGDRVLRSSPRGEASRSASPRGTTSFPRTSPRTDAPSRAPSVLSPRSSPRPSAVPRSTMSPRSSAAPRSTMSPRSSMPMRAPSVRSPSTFSPRTPTFRAPSFSPRSSPSFGGGRRHR